LRLLIDATDTLQPVRHWS